jgi:hypothetical protein
MQRLFINCCRFMRSPNIGPIKQKGIPMVNGTPFLKK